MRVFLLLIALALLLIESGGVAKPVEGRAVAASVSSHATERPRVDFDTQVKPIFKSKCMPCHFSGGQMYDSLPFDKPATIRKLGTRLFTRIKEDEDRKLIESFLIQQP